MFGGIQFCVSVYIKSISKENNLYDSYCALIDWTMLF